jgi:hypothetical protein
MPGLTSTPRIQPKYEADTAVDVGKVEPHSPATSMMHQSGRRNRIVVDVAGSSQDGSNHRFDVHRHRSGSGLRRGRVEHGRRRRLESREPALVPCPAHHIRGLLRGRIRQVRM